MPFVEQLSGYELKKLSNSRYAVLTDRNRSEVLEEIACKLNVVYDRTPMSASSVGCVDYDGIKILAKPKSKQGNKSPGVDNEIILYDKLKSCIGKRIILFNGSVPIDVGKAEIVERTASDVSNRKKTDILINDYHISLKKDDAEIWESADSYYKDKTIDIINNHNDLLSLDGNIYKISPNIAVKATPEEELDVVFGSDILGQGGVIFRTFTNSDFIETSDELRIRCSKIIQNQDDLKDKSVYFLIRNDKTRRTIPNYPGIRVLAVSESRVNSRVKRI